MKNIVYFLVMLSVVEIFSVEHKAESFEAIALPWIDHQFSRLKNEGFQSEVNVETLIKFVKSHYGDLEHRLIFKRDTVILSPAVVEGCTDIVTILKVGTLNKALHDYIAINYKGLINACVKETDNSYYMIDHVFMLAYLFQHSIRPEYKPLFAVGSDIFAATIGRYDELLSKNDTSLWVYCCVYPFCELFGSVMIEPNSAADIIRKFKQYFNYFSTCSMSMLGASSSADSAEEHEQLFYPERDCSRLRGYVNTLYVKMMGKILFFKKTAEFTVYSKSPITAPYNLFCELKGQNIIPGLQEIISIESNKVMYKVTLTDYAKMMKKILFLNDFSKRLQDAMSLNKIIENALLHSNDV